jgi:hypothetical protein
MYDVHDFVINTATVGIFASVHWRPPNGSSNRYSCGYCYAGAVTAKRETRFGPARR